MADVVKFGREAVLALMGHCGWKSADRWDNKRLAEKLKQVKAILTEDTENPSDPKLAKTLVDVLAAIESDSSFEVLDDAPAPATEEKPVVKEKAAAKQKPKAEVAAAEAPAEAAEAPAEAPAAPKKRGRKPKAEVVEAEPEITEEAPEDETSAVAQSRTKVEVLNGVTAEKALAILGKKGANNQTNRKFGSSLTRRYQQLMLSGGWDFGLRVHVIIDTTGQMQNGQHVLSALIRAEKERKKNPEAYPLLTGPLKLDAIVERGIAPASANFIDIGKGRNHTDIVFRQHLFSDMKVGVQAKCSRWVATAAKILYNRLSLGVKVRGRSKFEHSALVGVLQNHPGLVESAKFLQGLDSNEQHKNCLKLLKVSIPYLTAAHYLAANSLQKNGVAMRQDEANDFFQQLAWGSGLEAGSPIYELREWLLRSAGNRGNDDLNRLYDALVVAWNAVESGDPVTGKSFSAIKPAAWVEMGGLDTRPE